MGKKLFSFSLMLLLVSAVFLTGFAKSAQGATKEKPMVIRLATEFSPVELIMVSMKKVQEAIPEKTGGLVKLELYPAGTLYNFPDAMVALKAGQLEMGFNGRPAAPIIREWDVITSLPFLFDDRAHFMRFQETDAYKHLCARMEAMGIKPLTRVYPMGNEHIMNSKRPVETLDDLRGLKLTVPPGGVLTEAMKVLGVTSVPVPIPELPSALETGMVDGLECHHVPQVFIEFPRLVPYCTVTNICWYGAGLAASAKWWNTVPPDLQETLQGIFEDAMDGYGEATFAFSEEQFGIYKATPGTVVTQLPAAEKAKWVEALKPLRDKLKKDPKIREIIEAADSIR